jgi:hypothetical protein
MIEERSGRSSWFLVVIGSAMASFLVASILGFLLVSNARQSPEDARSGGRGEPIENKKDADQRRRERTATNEKIRRIRGVLKTASEGSEANAAKLEELEKTSGPLPDAKDQIPQIPPEEQARKAVAALLAITETGRQRAVKKRIADIVKLGDLAVPLLAEALASGMEDRAWRGFASTEKDIRSYPSLRCALVDALCQIGTPRAIDASLKVLEKSKSIREITVALSSFSDSTNPAIVQGMTPLLLMKFNEVGRDAPYFKQNSYSRLLVDAARNWRLLDDPEFMDQVRSTVASMSGYERCFADFLILIVHRSPEEALKIVLDKNSGPGKVRIIEMVGRVPYGFRSEINIGNYLNFIQRVFQSKAGTESDRNSIIFDIGAFLRLIKDRDITENDKTALRNLLEIIKKEREKNTEARLLRIFDHRIKGIEEILKK